MTFSARHSLPTCISFPSLNIVEKLPDSEWNACIQSWESILEVYLCCPLQSLDQNTEQFATLSDFLVSFLRAAANGQLSSRTTSLRRSVFFIIRRLLLDASPVSASLLSWQFLGYFCRAFHDVREVHEILNTVSVVQEHILQQSLLSLKNNLLQKLKMRDSRFMLDPDMTKNLLTLAKDASLVGTVLLSGYDFLDAALVAYPKLDMKEQHTILLLIFITLSSLMQGEKRNRSLLFDILYNLKSSVSTARKATEAGQSLISDLVTDTPLLPLIELRLSGVEADRASSSIFVLLPLRRSQFARRRAGHRILNDEESLQNRRAATTLGHLRATSSLKELQDLFPELNAPFTRALLDFYDNEVEAATAALLDQSFPAYLRKVNQTDSGTDGSKRAIEEGHVPPSSTDRLSVKKSTTSLATNNTVHGHNELMSERKNKYDNDALDSLNISKSQIHRGKRLHPEKANILLDQGAKDINAKAAIMAALAAFDADDDEHDDTYDAEDVGGTVDVVSDFASDDLSESREEILHRAWIMPGSERLFARAPTARRSADRASLRLETSMTDEAIEGWAIMLGREPARLQRLEKRFGDRSWHGPNHEIQSTRWREVQDGESTSDIENVATRSQHLDSGGSRRDRMQWSQGNGNSDPRPTDSKGAQLWRSKKDTNKAGRANHNRRNQRAKKMARGG